MDSRTVTPPSSTSSRTDEDRSVGSAVMRVLAYFDVFAHPLRTDEILRFLPQLAADPSCITSALLVLEAQGLVHRSGVYWALADVEVRAEQRLVCERRARSRMPKAALMSRRIARFPFVRAVFISGSLSKGVLAADGDIDFFVVTTPGRLWVARTLLMLYKKIFLLNSRRDFCVNYFLDSEHLTVEDRNRYTATEVVTLIPMYGNGTTEAFFARNAWAFGMYPNMPRPASREVSIGRGRLKRRLERSMSGRLGALLDRSAMRITWRFWKHKFAHLDARTFELAFRTRTYVSKHHPRNFQDRVLSGYEARLAKLEGYSAIAAS
ncbi:MAG: hypothetical protein R2811_01205 [Flavobacteriales bacterium]